MYKMFDIEQFIDEIQQNECIWNKRKYCIDYSYIYLFI